MIKYDITQPILLKTGVYDLNSERNFDYQLNRVINWDGGRLEDVEPVAPKIKTSADWKRELIQLGDTAMREERTGNAIAYYRMSEFFCTTATPTSANTMSLRGSCFTSITRSISREKILA
ncbi:MAG: hypothetical protein IJT87_08955 [Ruminiclostridium sp.]|nr:hypothetical protein [Ruminiclostridium sp.]